MFTRKEIMLVDRNAEDGAKSMIDWMKDRNVELKEAKELLERHKELLQREMEGQEEALSYMILLENDYERVTTILGNIIVAEDLALDVCINEVNKK